MTVKTRGPLFDYVNVAGQLMAHPTQCPDINSPCHAWLWRLTEAASIALDMATAEFFSPAARPTAETGPQTA